MSKVVVPQPKTKFLRVKCKACGNEQTIFSAAAIVVRCLACNKELAYPASSKARVVTKVLKEFE